MHVSRRTSGPAPSRSAQAPPTTWWRRGEQAERSLFGLAHVLLDLAHDLERLLRRDDLVFLALEDDATGCPGISGGGHEGPEARVHVAAPAERQHVLPAVAVID